MSFQFELAALPVRACIKQKSYTLCTFSCNGDSRITSAGCTNVTPATGGKKNPKNLKLCYFTVIKLYNCCQATECSCGRADPLIVWITLWSSDDDAWQHHLLAAWDASYVVLYSFSSMLLDACFKPGVAGRFLNLIGNVQCLGCVCQSHFLKEKKVWLTRNPQIYTARIKLGIKTNKVQESFCWTCFSTFGCWVISLLWSL